MLKKPNNHQAQKPARKEAASVKVLTEEHDLPARISELEGQLPAKVLEMVERQYALYLASVQGRREQEQHRRIGEPPASHRRRTTRLKAAWKATDQAARWVLLQRATKGCQDKPLPHVTNSAPQSPQATRKRHFIRKSCPNDADSC